MIFLKRQLNTNQLFGSGLALILLMLLGYIFLHTQILLYFAVSLVILLMIWPQPFRYFGIFWFAFGEALGFVVSKILLTIVYGLLVIPIGLLKRKSIRHNMQLSVFKKDETSVFKSRNYTFSEKDFEKPF
jgi:hypothetical protein